MALKKRIFETRPVQVEAIQFTGRNTRIIASWLGPLLRSWSYDGHDLVFDLHGTELRMAQREWLVRSSPFNLEVVDEESFIERYVEKKE